MSDEIKTADTIEIVVDDGMRDVRIRNLKGEQIGLFKFRPTDMGIIDRYNKLVKDFDAITEPLADVSIKADGTAESELDTSKLNEAEQRLYAACDEMFGGNMSEAFFGKMHPFSPVNGVFFCETAISQVGKFIGQQFGQELKKINTRVERYTKKYAGKGRA